MDDLTTAQRVARAVAVLTGPEGGRRKAWVAAQLGVDGATLSRWLAQAEHDSGGETGSRYSRQRPPLEKALEAERLAGIP